MQLFKSSSRKNEFQEETARLPTGGRNEARYPLFENEFSFTVEKFLTQISPNVLS